MLKSIRRFSSLTPKNFVKQSIKELETSQEIAEIKEEDT
jgi:hypothetical protein